MKMKTGEENQKLPWICSHKNPYVNVYSGIIHNGLNTEMTQGPSAGEQKNKWGAFLWWNPAQR